MAGSIECFIEDHSFLPTYELAPSPSPPLSPVSKLDQRDRGRRRKKDTLLTGECGGGGGGISYDREKAWPSIKHSILSGDRDF